MTAVISEDVGPERPREIADGFTSRVKREDETGWASEEELLASLKTGNSRTPDQILRAYAHYGSKPRADGRIIWKRDPAIGNGFVPDGIMALRAANQGAHHLYFGRPKHDRSPGNSGGTETRIASSPNRHNSWSRTLS